MTIPSVTANVLKRVYHYLNGPVVSKRMQQLADMPKANLAAKHTSQGRLLPNRISMLDLLPKSARVAEIGVADGDFSAEILKRCGPEKLFLVDLWDSERYRRGRAKVENRFAEQVNSGQVVLCQGYSTTIMKEFPTGSLDWVYIDSDHTYSTTAEELSLAEQVVKRDGKILGHDFCTASAGMGVVYGVVQAVNEFCVSRNWQFDYVALDPEGHFTFCLSRVTQEF